MVYFTKLNSIMGQKHKITIIFGERASDYACDYGEEKAIARINKEKLEGMVCTYELDTADDLKVLLTALGDFDGWNGWWVCNDNHDA